jgi:hypothetical protein
MAFRALVVSLCAQGMAFRLKKEYYARRNASVFDLAGHLEDVASFRKEGQRADCHTPDIRARAAQYEKDLIGNKTASARPTAVLLVGGPGSGKSTIRPVVAPDDQYVIMDIDHVLRVVYKPEPDSYYECFDPALVLYKQWRAKLIARRINLVIDSCGGKFDEYVQLATHLKGQTYVTKLLAVVLPFHKAKGRMEKRAKLEHRRVDLDYAEETYGKIETILPRYLTQTVFDTAEVFSSDVEEGRLPEKLMEKSGDTFACSFHDRENDNQLHQTLYQMCP